MAGIYLAQPVYRSLSPRTATAIQKVLTSIPAGEHVTWEPYWGDALIARARSIQATRFLEDHPECDVMVMIDDDIVFMPDAFWRIVAGARATKGVVAGTYVTHGETPHLTAREWPGAEPMKITDNGPSNLVHVEYVATGFMAVHREAVANLLTHTFENADGKFQLHRCQRGSGDKPMYPFFDTFTTEEAPGLWHWLSEDWAFCELINQSGAHCYVDTAIKLEHMGYHGQTVDDLVAPPTGAGIGTEAVTVGVTITGDPLIDNLPQDLAKFSGQPIESVHGALPDGTALVSKLWKEWQGTEREFYEYGNNGPAYALDLAWWHMNHDWQMSEHSPTYSLPMDYAVPLKDQRVLDIGAGIGTFALACARAGATEVSIAESNPWLSEFAYWRARQYGTQFTTPSGLYDTVVCWHVLEHVEDVAGMLAEIAGFLKPEGQLILQADFNADADHPMHHEMSDEEFDTLLAGSGFARNFDSDHYRRVLLLTTR